MISVNSKQKDLNSRSDSDCPEHEKLHDLNGLTLLLPLRLLVGSDYTFSSFPFWN
jgi:hypothetical protein